MKANFFHLLLFIFPNRGAARKENDPINPVTAHARSKVRSEKALAELDRNGMLIALCFAAACGGVKVVRAIRGALGPDRRSARGVADYLKWFGAELADDNRSMLYIQRGFGHGFITRRHPSPETLVPLKYQRRTPLGAES